MEAEVNFFADLEIVKMRQDGVIAPVAGNPQGRA